MTRIHLVFQPITFMYGQASELATLERKREVAERRFENLFKSELALPCLPLLSSRSCPLFQE